MTFFNEVNPDMNSIPANRVALGPHAGCFSKHIWNHDQYHDLYLADCKKNAGNTAVSVIGIAIIVILLITIFRNFPKWKSIAATPIRRIGLVFLFAAMFIFSSTALHWRMIEGPFTYLNFDSYFVTDTAIKEPLVAPAGTRWEKDLGGNGWRLYDSVCKEEARKTAGYPIILYDSEYKHCEKKHILNKIEKYSLEWKQSISNYFDSSRYQNWLLLVTFLFCSGSFMYSGFADKLLRWIRSGNDT